MIRDFYSSIKGPHLFITLLFLGLGLVMLALSFRGYKEHSQQEILVSDSAATSVSQLSIQDLQAMFDLSPLSTAAEHEIIARKNLFSPDRQAWRPPPSREDAGEERAAAQTRTADPGAFRLYGITASTNEKIALIYYEHLSNNNKHRLVREGDVVYSDRHGGIAYRVISIGQDKVTLEADSDSFEISLYGHERRNLDTSARDSASIVIGGRPDAAEAPARHDLAGPELDAGRDE